MDPLFIFLAFLLFSSYVAIGFLFFGLTAHQKKPSRHRPRHYYLIQRCRLRRYRFVKGLIESFQTQPIADANKLHLYVQANKTMLFMVSKCKTVEHLKKKVGSKIGVSYRSIRLTYATKDLVDKCRLGEFLPDQATLHLSLRPSCRPILPKNNK
jgi:hypothetical protein